MNRWLFSALVAGALLVPPVVRADEASGTWTGQVELRTNYYWETSTRVVAPEVAVRLDSPEGTRVTAGYLLDAITSASLAAGVQEDIRFTEVRNQGTLGVSREFDLGESQLRLGTSGRVSHEPDYVATGISAFGSLSLNQRSTVITAALTYIHDDVGAVIRGGVMTDLSDRGRQGQLEGFTAVASWSQVLSPVTTLVTGYQLVHNWGYLQNAYRRTSVAGTLLPEQHPSQRTRHSVWGRFAHFVPETQTAFHVMCRAYLDDWDIGSLDPEVRVYQMIGPSVLLRLRYRYHRQTSSFFYEEMYDVPQTFVTADQKMADFHSHLWGAQLRVGLDFLGPTFLAFLERAWIDFSFNYWVQTSGFGDGILAQAGLRAPF